jgi:hypothetical protein
MPSDEWRNSFSTHALNMDPFSSLPCKKPADVDSGQRRVELETSLVSNSDGSGTLHVAPLPANGAL